MPFDDDVIDAIAKAKILGIRAGSGDHKFTGVWPVVVERRVFVRSWGVKKGGWFSTFAEEPRGTIQLVDGRQIAVRAVRTRSERIKAAVDAAYAAKFHTPASKKWVDGFKRSKKRRDTTTELVPV